VKIFDDTCIRLAFQYNATTLQTDRQLEIVKQYRAPRASACWRATKTAVKGGDYDYRRHTHRDISV